MASLLVHIHTGPQNPTKSALGLLVGLTAKKEGHDVTFFLAGDGVHLLSSEHADVTGTGTGRIGDHLEGLKQAGAQMFLSGMSAKARGYDESLLEGFNASFAMPTVLVEQTFSADKVLCY